VAVQVQAGGRPGLMQWESRPAPPTYACTIVLAVNKFNEHQVPFFLKKASSSFGKKFVLVKIASLSLFDTFHPQNILIQTLIITDLLEIRLI
jgi:glutathione synthase/RimK-type ligase-like ATP-grasp enzyme